MNVAKYLRRIGMEEAPAVTIEGLNELIRSHQSHVPFENLTLYDLGQRIDIAPEALYEKIVEQHRGGYCFELNGAFCQLLQALGFDAWCVYVRVAQGGVNPAINHRGILVRIQGVVHYADVGKGDLKPTFAVPLDGDAHTQGDETYRMAPDQDDSEWAWLLSPQGPEGQWEPCLRFSWTPRSDEEFLAPNQEVQDFPESVFSRKRMIFMRSDGGMRTIDQEVYSFTKNGTILERSELDEEVLVACLKEKFGIELGQ